MAVATYSAVNVVGLPEAAENLAQLVLYLGECLRWAALLSKIIR
jgi:replication-associated recombination protein RarA